MSLRSILGFYTMISHKHSGLVAGLNYTVIQELARSLSLLELGRLKKQDSLKRACVGLIFRPSIPARPVSIL
jgi:hypothetical protein